jgi:hypothetical protein
MMRKTPLLLFIVALLLAACVPLPPVTPPPPTILPNPSPAALAAPVAVEYNLGETTITQARFPEDSRFRNMPVRLNGVIAAPTGGTGPFPVILILHGTHPGCPAVGEVDAWPCSPDVEQRNYRGFAYLTEALAAQGYVALSININAEYTFGFGEVGAGERLNQIVERHLAALATASAGGENNFGVELDGVADMERLGLAGHSRGAELAVMLARESQAEATKGVLQIAPSPVLIDPAPGLPVPLGAVQAMCDGDVQDISGQVFYEALRLAEGQSAWANSVFLERANHNGFNTMLDGDPFGLRGRPDCASLLAPEQQQAFLSAYAAAFFDAVFLEGALAEQNKASLGLDARKAAPATLGGADARVASFYPAEQRIVLFTPASEAELTTNRLGGAVIAAGVTTHFCPEGYYTPLSKPGSEPCKRATVPIPGQPALAVVNWEGPGTLRFAVPEGAPGGVRDWSDVEAISLRAAVDPLSELNAKDQHQALTVRVTDGKGQTAAAKTRPDEPALRFPAGEVESDATFGDMFTGKAPLTTLRVLRSQLDGVDWSDVREVTLVFEGTGALFLADVEAVE